MKSLFDNLKFDIRNIKHSDFTDVADGKGPNSEPIKILRGFIFDGQFRVGGCFNTLVLFENEDGYRSFSLQGNANALDYHEFSKFINSVSIIRGADLVYGKPFDHIELGEIQNYSWRGRSWPSDSWGISMFQEGNFLKLYVSFVERQLDLENLYEKKRVLEARKKELEELRKKEEQKLQAQEAAKLNKKQTNRGCLIIAIGLILGVVGFLIIQHFFI